AKRSFQFFGLDLEHHPALVSSMYHCIVWRKFTVKCSLTARSKLATEPWHRMTRCQSRSPKFASAWCPIEETRVLGSRGWTAATLEHHRRKTRWTKRWNSWTVVVDAEEPIKRHLTIGSLNSHDAE